ncbi:hypothetical protein ABE61_01275 [Lysinibacillus sphaericus]|nr:hypothetical protein [Lysinibacillus sphaericus]MBG9479789.1 hypothetical protein [Lysinibacillus sphaericus]MBG9595291.1 hypothetical protein [Lysinibacillus sphaericus]
MGISDRGSKAKSITSCDNAFVTNILLPRRPQEALLCAKAKRQQQQMFSVAKAKHQLQSAQMERKSTTHFGGNPFFYFDLPMFSIVTTTIKPGRN